MKANIIFLLLIGPFVAGAQNWELVRDIEVREEISAVSIDSRGLIYVGTANGNVVRYNPEGEEDEYFSELNNSAITTIQAWNRLKLFTFFRDQQSIGILDRFTTTPKTIDLTDLGLQFAWLFAPGIDHSYWALSTELREIVKYDDQNLNILFSLPLTREMKLTEPTIMRAYKNLLIIADQSTGLWFFNQYGELLGNLAEAGIQYFQINDGLIHTTNGNEYLKIDPFTMQILERKKAPDGAFGLVVITGDKFIFFSKDKMLIYMESM